MEIKKSRFKVNSNGTFSLRNDNCDDNKESYYDLMTKNSITEKLRETKREKGLMCKFCNSTLDLIKVKANLEGENIIKICGGCIEDFNEFEVEYEILEKYDGDGNII